MSCLTMTLRGLLTFDENLLKDNIQLPSEIDKNLFCDFLLYECDELEVLIANPAVFADALKKWSTFQLPMWEYYYKIESRQKEINPLTGESKTYTRDYTRTPNLTTKNITEETIDTNYGSTDTKKNAGFNSASPITSTINTVDDRGVQGTNNTKNITETGNDKITEKIKEEKTKDADSLIKWIEMKYLNTANKIVSDFKERFCLLIY
nr:MAG TPA: hypothetical protein [Caudoviricetes sp.]